MGWFESSSNRRNSNYQGGGGGGGGGGGATRCKKHPKHKKLQGVCPSCLSQKLSKISKKNKKMNGGDSLDSSSSSSSASCYSSASDSSCSSPPYPYPIKFTGRRNSVSSTKDGRLSFSMDVDGGFTRSRSVALVARNWVETDFAAAVVEQEDHQNVEKKDKRKSGFWSKLLLHKGSSNTSKRKQNKEHQVILMHCKTVKESRSIPFF